MAATAIDTDAILTKLGDVPEVTYVAETRAACNGGGGALGHPKTYYTINDEGYARCG